jgi:hypothetical protein
MIVVLGLVLLLAAVVVAVAGVLGNAGSGHELTDGFSVFGYHVTGSTGTVFLYGIVVGVIALLGLTLLLAGARRTSRRGRAARRELQASRRETAAVSQDREDLLEQRETERAESATVIAQPATAAENRQSHVDDELPPPAASPGTAGTSAASEGDATPRGY